MDAPTSSSTTDVPRTADGRWLKPPRGRPRGTGETDKARKFLEPKREAVLTKLAELAEAGDGKAQALFLSFFSSGARPEDEKVVVPGFADAPSLAGKASAVMEAIAAGEISATAGQRLLQTLETFSRVVTASDLEARLQALERGTPRPVTIDGSTGDLLPDNSDLA